MRRLLFLTVLLAGCVVDEGGVLHTGTRTLLSGVDTTWHRDIMKFTDTLPDGRAVTCYAWKYRDGSITCIPEEK